MLRKDQEVLAIGFDNDEEEELVLKFKELRENFEKEYDEHDAKFLEILEESNPGGIEAWRSYVKNMLQISYPGKTEKEILFVLDPVLKQVYIERNQLELRAIKFIEFILDKSQATTLNVIKATNKGKKITRDRDINSRWGHLADRGE